MKRNKRFELARAEKITALARTLDDYLIPLGINPEYVGQHYLQDPIEFATSSGLILAQQRTYPVPRRNGCRPGDIFNPFLMTADGILPGSDVESRLVEAGARVAMVLSAPFLAKGYDLYGVPAWDVETAEGDILAGIIVRKGNVICYTMKDCNDGSKSVKVFIKGDEV